MNKISPRQSAAMRARIQRVRAKYRKRMLIVGIIFFIIPVFLKLLL